MLHIIIQFIIIIQLYYSHYYYSYIDIYWMLIDEYDGLDHKNPKTHMSSFLRGKRTCDVWKLDLFHFLIKRLVYIMRLEFNVNGIYGGPQAVFAVCKYNLEETKMRCRL